MEITTDIFIDQANKIHNGIYDYSKTIYVKAKDKVIIICKLHGEFTQEADSHKQGRGCPHCTGKLLKTTDQFIEDSIKVHGYFYNYSKSNYINAKTKVLIICPKHGEFEQTPNKHLMGEGCSDCGKERSSKHLSKGTATFIHEAILVHSNFYDYSLVEYTNGKLKVDIICPKHGTFKQAPIKHLSGQGCRKCRQSVGERRIASFMYINNIEVIQEWTNPTCIDIRKLKFDFYIPKLDILIEYDGPQHYEVYKYSDKNSLKQTQRRDQIKNQWASDNNYHLIRIPYWDFDNIEAILTKELNL